MLLLLVNVIYVRLPQVTVTAVFATRVCKLVPIPTCCGCIHYIDQSSTKDWKEDIIPEGDASSFCVASREHVSALKLVSTLPSAGLHKKAIISELGEKFDFSYSRTCAALSLP